MSNPFVIVMLVAIYVMQCICCHKIKAMCDDIAAIRNDIAEIREIVYRESAR